MKAEEMFNELGFGKYEHEGRNNNFGYRGVNPYYSKSEIYISFMGYNDGPIYTVRNDRKQFCLIDPKLHQAIHQQLKELGWI